MEWEVIVGCAYDATITVGTATTTCDINIQLKDFAGNDLTEPAAIYAYVSSDADGLDYGDFTSLAITSSGDGSCVEVVTDKLWHLISETDGDIDVTADGSGADTMYLNLVMPNGKIVHSSVITFSG